MPKSKWGFGSIEISKKFESEAEAFKHARALQEKLGYICRKQKTDWQAQALIVVSDTRGSCSKAKYERNGKRGRPKKVLNVFDDHPLYKHHTTVEWHIHILILSKPVDSFSRAVKAYIDKNWGVSEKTVYRKKCDVNIAQYFIDQNTKILFFNSSDLKYSLKQYNSEYINNSYRISNVYKKNKKYRYSEEELLELLERADRPFRCIEEYFRNIDELNTENLE